MNQRPLFVSFEGGEGVGKTTQIALLAEHLRSTGRDVVTTREPGGSPLGAELRRLILDPDGEVTPRAEALLFAADRAHHVDTVIRPALGRGAVVITDRYVDSSLAYQGAGHGHGVEEIGKLSAYATGGLMPDVTFLFDLDPLVGLSRARARGETAAGNGGPEQMLDRLESLALGFHTRLREGFLTLAAAEPDRFTILDASVSREILHARVVATLDLHALVDPAA